MLLVGVGEAKAGKPLCIPGMDSLNRDRMCVPPKGQFMMPIGQVEAITGSTYQIGSDWCRGSAGEYSRGE